MELLSNPLWLPVMLVMISVLVAAHELGHFLVARLCKMDVDEFAIGLFRPKWVWMKRGKTEFTLRAIPFGGFVRVTGMEPQDDGSEVNVPNGFYSKPPFQRFMVLFAGPIFSIAFGVLLLAGVYAFDGKEVNLQDPVIGYVHPGSPADKAGLKVEDRIVKIDDKPVTKFYDVLAYVRTRGGVPIAVEFERAGTPDSTTVTPEKDPSPTPVRDANLEITGETAVQAKIGVRWKIEKRPLPVGEALIASSKAPIIMATSLVSMVSTPTRLKDEVGGPGTIATFTQKAAEEGFFTVCFLAAMLSISLGFMNLLPIPPLDGGQMVVAFVEMLRRGKRLSMQVQAGVSTVGAVLVFSLIAYVLFIDVARMAGK